MGRGRVRLASIAALAAALLGSGIAAAPGAQAADRVPVRSLLRALDIAPESSAGYDRALFPHWTSTGGCTTREWVLIRQADGGERRGCVMVGSTWFSPFDGVTTTNPSTFDIDHRVPLAEAWRSGARTWSTAVRTRFANDLGYRPSLVAVTASSNRSKGDRDPAQWLPPRKADTCAYVTRWIGVKWRWGLSVDRAEYDALRIQIAECPRRMPRPERAIR